MLQKDDHNSTCSVHQAVLHNSLIRLKVLVEEDVRSLTCTNSLGQTPLLTGIITSRSENIIFYLIEAGSDVNALDCWHRNSLHTAIEHRLSYKVIQKLLEKGANVDAQDTNGHTPMHHAVLHGIDLLTMLLYHNADVTIESNEGHTALARALGWFNFDAVDVLIDYYCTEDLTDIINNYFYSNSNHWQALQFILKLDTSRLFKIIWSIIDTIHLLETLPIFILTYLNQCNFPKHEWVESLLMILESDIAYDLIRKMNRRRSFRLLLCSLYYNKIDYADRVVLINVFLMLGAEVCLNDFIEILNIYGYGTEFECLAYGVPSRKFDTIQHPLCFYLVNLETDYSTSHVLELFKNQISAVMWVGSRVLQESVIRNFGYFALPGHVRHTLLEECVNARFNCNKIKERLSTIPDFPTLLELSRNQVRNHIIRSYKVKYAYNMLDVIKRLPIPQIIKDIILFKSTIY